MGEERGSQGVGDALTDREQSVLDAVVRTYVASAEPAGSRTLVDRFELGVSAATVRNTMTALEEKGYLFHRHTSSGRVPTDLAYRFFVDQLIRPGPLSEGDRRRLERELDSEGSSAIERLVSRATRALSILTHELGVAVGPQLRSAVLERIELVRVSAEKVLMVATVRSGVVRTVYVDLPGGVEVEVLATVTLVLNERLSGLTLGEISETLPARLRDVCTDQTTSALLNIFVQASPELFGGPDVDGANVHLGHTSVLAAQPEFTTGARLKNLIELTEEKAVLADALLSQDHRSGLTVTIGGENSNAALADFTLVTAEYHVGNLKGVIGVIGPTRMPYEQVIAIVDNATSLINSILAS